MVPLFAAVLPLCALAHGNRAILLDRPSVVPNSPAHLYPLSAVRLLPSPFMSAVQADIKYLLALDPDRLLAPYLREAGLPAKAQSYGSNWETGGLDGHTAGHYLSALADMIAAGHDETGEFRHRLAYMVHELGRVQTANQNGYAGSVPGSREYWKLIAGGHVDQIWNRWAPWYVLHKTMAGLRDAYVQGGLNEARGILIGFADWTIAEVSGLSDDQVQQMLSNEHGGMNELLADVYAITGDPKYLAVANRFCHQSILSPLVSDNDQLTGLHANTQIPKVTGFEQIALLTGDGPKQEAARFFWQTVTTRRSAVFGGNSVSEHFNNPMNFKTMLEDREGPETCNTYNMLRLTEHLFQSEPDAKYADYYERALYNHILASIDTAHPGFVYLTPIRPQHYRVYSRPDKNFWCCVGTGMENPGRYGQFVYAKSPSGIYVNLFIPSILKDDVSGLTLRQDTKFPDEERTTLTVSTPTPKRTTLYVRHPWWVKGEKLRLRINGKQEIVSSAPSSYVALSRQWRSGDKVELELPMQTTVQQLPDGSDWYALLRGPIVLASPSGTQDQDGLFGGDRDSDHSPNGKLVPLDQVPALLSAPKDLPGRVRPDAAAGPLHFTLKVDSYPSTKGAIHLIPFFRLQEERYQMYWELTSKDGLAERARRKAEAEKLMIARDLATVDRVSPGEQQSEKDHLLTGDAMETGVYNGIHWRHGHVIQYRLFTKGSSALDLAVTYAGGDVGRVFDVFVNGVLLKTQELNGTKPGEWLEIRDRIPGDALAASKDGTLVVRFVAKKMVAGGIYGIRLMRTGEAIESGPRAQLRPVN